MNGVDDYVVRMKWRLIVLFSDWPLSAHMIGLLQQQTSLLTNGKNIWENRVQLFLTSSDEQPTSNLFLSR
jgi:hypothetical protein